jgi:hypothetical protein
MSSTEFPFLEDHILIVLTADRASFKFVTSAILCIRDVFCYFEDSIQVWMKKRSMNILDTIMFYWLFTPTDMDMMIYTSTFGV